MRHFYLLALAILAVGFGVTQGVQAQNVQLHYDLGKTIYDKDQPMRPSLTTTVEMFRPDKWGDTFFFVDMNYQSKGVLLAYWEIARNIRLWKAPIALHLEYNGGVGKGFSIPDAYLVGANYAYNASDFSWGFGITPMYKYLSQAGGKHSAQLTATWYAHFAGGALSFTGFADLWGDYDVVAEERFNIFLAEPQLWLNLNKLRGVSPEFNLSIGTEVELSNNFAGSGFYAIPTLALKWTFK